MAPAAAQKTERIVNVYNWSDYIAPGVTEDFTKETGIKVRYDTFDSNDTLETKLLAGKSGYDVVVPTAYFLERQIKAGVFQKLDKAKLPNLANMWPEITQRLATTIPATSTPSTTCGARPASATTSRRRARILGGDGKIDSWDIVFKPENLAKFKDCGVHMLDSADDILPAALNYLGLDPNTSKEADLQKAADLMMKIRPFVRKFHSSEYLNALASGEICLVVGFSGDIKQAQKRARKPRTGSRSPTRSRRKARNCGSTISRSRATPGTWPKRTRSSTTCRSRRWRRRTRTSSPMPTAIWRARNSSTRRSWTTRPSIRTMR